MNVVNLNSASLNSKRLNVIGEIRSSAGGGGGGGVGYDENYLTLIIEDRVSFNFPISLEYNVDGSGWTSVAASTWTPFFEKGQFVAVRANATQQINKISANGGSFSVAGNIMSLIYGDNAADNDVIITNIFESLFSGCKSLVGAKELKLPATTLANDCYRFMFNGCTSLVTAPELPATTLANYCYQGMFNGCTSLVTAPELPATTLANYCYQSMFSGCTSLVTAPELPATTLKESAYNSMFSGCTRLVTAPELPATTLANSCYGNMFSGCTSLVSAPELPTKQLSNRYCYNYMFNGCTSLKYVKAMFTSVSYANAVSGWLTGVAENGVFVKNSAATWDNATYGVPSGWTIEYADA